MKKTLAQILNDADARELDVLLENVEEEPLDATCMERLQTDVLSRINPVPQKKLWRRAAVIAACAAVLLSVGFGTYAYAAEVREYNAAVQFFDQYDLSTEGLTRGEIKAVYRDIITGSFTCSKTAQVLEESMVTNHVPGFEILQEEPSPEQVEDLWNRMNSQNAEGIRYQFDSKYIMNEALGFEVHDYSTFEKYSGSEQLWCAKFEEFWIEDYAPVTGGVLIYGQTPVWSSNQTRYAWLAKVSDSGEICWKRRLENDFRSEYIGAVLENADGSYAVFSRGDFQYLCLSRYTEAGERIQFQMTDVGNYGIWNAVRFQEGYLVQLGSYVTNEHAKIVRVDAEGNITESFSYESADSYYYIADMIEFGGRIYLSAYAVPALEGEEEAGGRYEIAAVLQEIYAIMERRNTWEISSEELTPMVRENYTALLLVCDPEKGNPQEFYCVEGSRGGGLALSDEGELLWDVESIATTYFSPATSAFTIGGTSCIYRYTFDTDGSLISQEDTGEVAMYYR